MEAEITFREIDVTTDASTANKYRIQATPTIIILDPAGREVETFVGTPSEEELQTAIDKAVSS